jgi:hypothetical protein
MAENPTSEELRTAVELLKEGKRAEARVVLIDAITQSPRDELGWFLLSFAVTDPGQQKDCLERVLRINPGNSNARSRLEKLGGTPPPEPIPQPVTPPFVTGEGETGAASTPPAPMLAHGVVAEQLEPSVSGTAAVPDQHVTPVVFEPAGVGEAEESEEHPEEAEGQEPGEEAGIGPPAVGKPPETLAPVAAVVASPAPPGAARTAQAATRSREPVARRRGEKAPGWMVGIIVLLLLVIIAGAAMVGWTYLRSPTGGGPAGGAATATQAAAADPLPPVMSLPPEWTRTPTATLTVPPTDTPSPSDTPSPPPLTPTAVTPNATLSATSEVAQVREADPDKA